MELFFDDPKEIFIEKIGQIQFNVSALLAEAKFYKKKKKGGSYKIKACLLFDDAILISKDDKENSPLTRKINLVFVRINMIDTLRNPNDPMKSKTVFSFGFQLMKNNETIELYTNDKKLFNRWRALLSSRCILQSFHDDFLVIKMIGKGSFAKVYLAQKKMTKENYAIKAFSKNYLTSQKLGKESLKNEITIMNTLDSPYTLKLYEVYETVHSVYLVLQLVTGGELINRLSNKGKYDLKDVKLLLQNLLRGIEHIHSKNIMHRDLKPSNILLKKENNSHEIVIADFGLSVFNEESKILYKHCGTPGFVAPEVLQYKKDMEFYTNKCDVFSAGAIFFILLTGRKLFSSEAKSKDPNDIIQLNMKCQIDFNIPELKTVATTALDLLKQMLEPDPIKRPSCSAALSHPFFLDTFQVDEEFIFIHDVQEKLKALQLKREGSAASDNKLQVSFQMESGFLSKKALLNGEVNTMQSFGDSPNASIKKLQAMSKKLQAANTSHNHDLEHDNLESEPLEEEEDEKMDEVESNMDGNEHKRMSLIMFNPRQKVKINSYYSPPSNLGTIPNNFMKLISAFHETHDENEEEDDK